MRSIRSLKLLPLLALLFAIPLLAVAGNEGPEPPSYTLPPDEMNPETVARSVTSDEPDWGVVRLKCQEVWKAGNKGKGVRVAVLDTGCDLNHPDLKDRIKSSEDTKDFTGSRYGVFDRQGHGTHCAGSVLASASSPLPGVAPEAELIVGKVLNDSGSGRVDHIMQGGNWAVKERNTAVISMSLGGPGADQWIPQMLKLCDEEGVIVIAAAGNEGPNPNTCGYPGRYPQSVCVAAVGRVGDGLGVAQFSSRCSEVYVAGPGVQIRSTWPGGQYATISGTSMATPHIAGLAALWIAANPNVPKKERPARFRAALQAACADMAPAGRDTATGYGFPDAVKLCGTGSIPQPMPRGILIGWDDLTDSAKSRLRASGMDAFKLELLLKP